MQSYDYIPIQSSSTFATATTVPTAPPDVTSSVSPGITDVGTDTGSQSSVGVAVGVGVGAVVLLVVLGVLGMGLFMWRRRHTSKVISTGNVSYDMSNMELSDNIAYDTTKRGSFKSEDYDYIPTTDRNDIIITFPNEAYATTGNVPVSSNLAFGMVHH